MLIYIQLELFFFCNPYFLYIERYKLLFYMNGLVSLLNRF